MERIGVVTSGGDAPGMNAAIRAIVRVAHSRGLRVLGFERGYEGLIRNSVRPLDPRSVGGILQLGGTILRSARCPEFLEDECIRRAAENLAADGVDGLIVIGGDGSFRGALRLSGVCGAAVVGVPATIDNDVFGAEETVGFDTAVNTAVSQIDKIRDTAVSFERTFVVEVMGRTRGFIALSVGLTAGAEAILVPEVPFSLDELCRELEEDRRKGKRSAIIVAAEGVGDTRRLTQEIQERTGSEARLTVLGYVQRGGSPTARSRLLANLFGARAVELLMEGRGNEIVGLRGGRVASVDLERSCKSVKPLDTKLLQLAKELAV